MSLLKESHFNGRNVNNHPILIDLSSLVSPDEGRTLTELEDFAGKQILEVKAP